MDVWIWVYLLIVSGKSGLGNWHFQATENNFLIYANTRSEEKRRNFFDFSAFVSVDGDISQLEFKSDLS